LSVERSTSTGSVLSTSLKTDLKVDGRGLALVLAGRQSKWSTLVVDLLLDKEGNAIDSSTVDIRRHIGSDSRSGGGCCSDSNSRDDGSSARESRTLDDSNDRNELSHCVCDCRCSDSNDSCLSARAL